MEQTFSSWQQSITAQIKHEQVLEEEAKKVFDAGGRVVEKEVTDPSGKKRRIAVLEFGRYQPKIKLGKKSLKKLGIYVEEVKYRDKKKKNREKSVDKRDQV
jgi:hypothetical protein